MMSRRVALLVCLALAGACASGGSARPAPMSESAQRATEDSVRTMLGEFARLGAAAQWDSLALLYDDAPNFSWIENGNVVARSRAEIRRGLEKVPPGMALATRFDPLEVRALDIGVVFVQTTSHTQFVNQATGAPAFGFSTMLTMIVVRRPDGWKLRQGHASGGR